MWELLRRRWHRLTYRRPPMRPAAYPISLLEEDPLVARVAATRPVIDRVLRKNILPFWFPDCIDRLAGGFFQQHDGAAWLLDPADRCIMTQARTAWFFARLIGTGILPEARAAAEHGYRYLRDVLWDRQGEGGFFWMLAADGSVPRDDRKLLMAQSFGLYAVAEYAAASRDAEAIGFAREIFEVIEQRFRDPINGGYRRQCKRDWSLALDAPGKTQNEHLHVLEAYARYSGVTDEPLVRDRLRELILALTSTMVRQTAGASTDNHRDDWAPVLTREYVSTSYGHDLEAVWLVLDACPVVGWAPTLVAEWGLTLMASAARWGWDRRRGGWYKAGPLGAPAHSRGKVWWVQAEALVATLALFRLTGDPTAGELYLKTLDWVVQHQIDWDGGEWYMEIGPRGPVSGHKADQWKAPYHAGRAMLECLELLEPGVTQRRPE